MYNSRNSILLLGITVSISMFLEIFLFLVIIDLTFLVLLWCTVQPTYADTNEEEHHLMNKSDEDNSVDEIDDYVNFYRRASLRPVVLHQRASLRPFAGKRASLRPFAGKRASLRPFAGKRASLRPATYMGKRKRRSVMYYDEE